MAAREMAPMPRRARGILDEAAYYGLAALFYLAPRILYDLHIDEDEATTFPPSTLVVTNHKRDLDSVILTAALYWRQRPPRAPLHFAGREDMFYPGFLAHFEVVPRWLRRLLYALDLTAVMEALRVFPVRRFPERTMDEALREALQLFGDRPLAEVLVPEEAEPVVRRLGPSARLSHALAWEFRARWRRPARLRAFREELRPQVQARQREVVTAQLGALADLVNRGGVLYIAPEGVISPDGRLQPFRSGLRHLLSLARGARIRPACIVYDFMKPGPLRVFIRVGRLLPAGGPPEAAAALARRRLAGLHVVTGSQLCSQVAWEALARGQEALPPEILAEEAVRLAARLQEEGLRVDGGFLRAPAARVRQWTAYARARGILAGGGPAVRITPAIAQQPATHWGNPVRYCVNELQSVRAALRGAVEAAAASG